MNLTSNLTCTTRVRASCAEREGEFSARELACTTRVRASCAGKQLQADLPRYACTTRVRASCATGVVNGGRDVTRLHYARARELRL